MKLTNENLEPGRHDSQLRALAAAGVQVTMCGEHHWRCELSAHFPHDARLLAWTGRMNSWPKVVRTLLPHAEELHGLYSAMALLVCLGAAATAYSATQAKFAVGVLALDWVLTLLGVRLAHAPVLAHASSLSLLRPTWRWLLALCWLLSLIGVRTAMLSRLESLAFATAIVALCSTRRVYLALLTLNANHKPSLALPLLAYLRLLGPPDTAPPDAAEDEALVALDGPTEELRRRRLVSLRTLRAQIVFRWPRANELTAALCGALDQATPLVCALRAPTRAPSVGAAGGTGAVTGAAGGAASTKGGESAGESAGEGGENAGEGGENAGEGGESGGESGGEGGSTGSRQAEPPTSPHLEPQSTSPATAASPGAHAAPTMTPVPPVAPIGPRVALGAGADDVASLAEANRAMLRRITRKEEVHFHLSGSEALQAAARLVRAHTGRPLLVTFGGAAPGWSDGVMAEGLALGEERYACNVLTLRERCSATLAVLRLRRDEIAGVLVSPLAGLALAEADAPAPERAAERAAYRHWLHELRAACTRCHVPLLLDETATGLRLGLGGAQAYFGVEADLVCLGKSAGGGLPLGAVCGSSALLCASEPRMALRAGAPHGTGGAAEHPALMRCTNGFLRTLSDEEAVAHEFAALNARIERWAAEVNEELRTAGLPMRVASEASVWAIRHLQPGRHHFVLLLYLAVQLAHTRLSLEWIGPSRLVHHRHTSAAELDTLHLALVRAARSMVADGWWAPPEQVHVSTVGAIRTRLAAELGIALGVRLAGALRSFLSLGAK